MLVGVSRTSKTPTSIYLANRGYKTANMPLVPGVPLPPRLEKLRRPLIVGLIASPERIVQIRQNRLLALNADTQTEYVDRVAVAEEIAASRRLFAERNWPIIDVTRRSIEETAAAILDLYREHRLKFIAQAESGRRCPRRAAVDRRRAARARLEKRQPARAARRAAGLTFETVASRRRRARARGRHLAAAGRNVDGLAPALARAKALAVSAARPGALVPRRRPDARRSAAGSCTSRPTAQAAARRSPRSPAAPTA